MRLLLPTTAGIHKPKYRMVWPAVHHKNSNHMINFVSFSLSLALALSLSLSLSPSPLPLPLSFPLSLSHMCTLSRSLTLSLSGTVFTVSLHFAVFLNRLLLKNAHFVHVLLVGTPAMLWKDIMVDLLIVDLLLITVNETACGPPTRTSTVQTTP